MAMFNELGDENGVVLDEEQLIFLAGGQDNVVDEDVDEPPVQDLALNVDNSIDPCYNGIPGCLLQAVCNSRGPLF
ncbi:hypothetical protein Tco_0462282 [Tanacetum coccineum]